jgi:asparagine synthetase B (glutamine-hydrolysing)
MYFCLFFSSYRSKFCDHTKVGVLFSGGLDSTVLAYLAAEVMESSSSSCSSLTSIDLLNVAFSKNGSSSSCSSVPDRETGLTSWNMLSKRFNKMEGNSNLLNLVLINESREEVEKMREEWIKDLISPLKTVIDDSVGCCLWFAARGQSQTEGQDQHQRSSETIRTVFMGSGRSILLKIQFSTTNSNFQI